MIESKQGFLSLGEKAKTLKEMDVRGLKTSFGKEFIIENHYSHGSHNGIIAYGLYDDSGLRGVCGFSCPCSENVRISVFGEEDKDRVIELSRLVCDDDTPKNTESWFVSRAINLLHKDFNNYNAIISFADETEGHKGTIYQALNFLFCGWTTPTTFFEDGEGRLRHPHQCGVNITLDEAKRRGWRSVKRGAKRRYVLLVGHWKEKEKLQKKLRWVQQPYPDKLKND